MPFDDPTTDYAKRVLSGDIVAGELVRLACRRHLDDIETGSNRGLVWRPDLAQIAIDFFPLLRHYKGQWAGQSFKIEPWQAFIVGSLWGWRRADGTRRFRYAHVEVARKNGKTTWAAVIGLLLFILDNEAGAEVYNTATKKDQARLCHRDAIQMVKASPALSKRIKIFKDNLSIEKTASKFEPLSSESKTLDGLNISGAICDELHAWPSRDLWDVIETATGARRQPLILSITTAGSGQNSIWWERRELAVRVLRGLIAEGGEIASDAIFAAIYTLDDGDDWTDPKVWIKGNPNLGVSVQTQELAEKCADAKAVPGKQNSFKRLRLNLPTQTHSLWLDLARWDRCSGQVNADELRGRACYLGVDLSATTDMTAAALLFRPVYPNEPWKVLMRYWLPEDGIDERCRRDRVPYDLWARQGHLKLTPGDVVDYEWIEAQIIQDAKDYDVRSILFDRYMANQLTSRLQNQGLPVKGYGQGFASMGPASRELELLVTSAAIATGGHPVLRFNASCASVRVDPAGNRKPDKSTSTGRIDGLVALLMALGAAVTDDQPVYGDGGFEAL